MFHVFSVHESVLCFDTDSTEPAGIKMRIEGQQLLWRREYHKPLQQLENRHLPIPYRENT